MKEKDVFKFRMLKIRGHRLGFFQSVQLDRYHADRAPASFMNAISRFRLTFFNYFNMHEDLNMIDDENNGEERDNDRRDEETEEEKATREYYERSVELERLWYKHYYSPFILLAYDINYDFQNIGARKKQELTMAGGKWRQD
jgi:hypothetical protein